MNTKKQLLACLTLVAALLATSPASAGKRRLLNRSLYLPVTFTLCEHLEKAIVYQSDQLVAREMPTTVQGRSVAARAQLARKRSSGPTRSFGRSFAEIGRRASTAGRKETV